MPAPPSGTELSILDQASSRRYTRLLYCYSLPESISYENTEFLVERFSYATGQILAKWPFLTCRIRLCDPRHSAGRVKLFNLQSQRSCAYNEHNQFCTDGVLSVKRISDWHPKVPNYRDLAKQGMSPDTIRSSDYCRPLPNLKDDYAVVYHISLNFIRGGLVLCVCYMNSVLDNAANSFIFEQFARGLTRPRSRNPGQDASVRTTRDHIRYINRLGARGSCLIDQFLSKRCPEFDPPRPVLLAHPLPTDGIHASYSPSDSVVGKVFKFPVSGLKKLRREIAQVTGEPAIGSQHPGMILKAWLWVLMLQARFPRGILDTQKSSLAFTVDVRGGLDIALNEHVRNATLYGYATLPYLGPLRLGTPFDRCFTIADAFRSLRSAAQSLNLHGITTRLGYLEYISNNPGSLKYNLNCSSGSDVIIDSFDWSGGNPDLGVFQLSKFSAEGLTESSIDLGQARMPDMSQAHIQWRFDTNSSVLVVFSQCP
ncbi:hypothetical protein AK830_g7223 [Neonectria ditissima]|uniref:Uncharacterized protein n=1 Tax=Neonectria ditissima TaxID=78410 RepID=A0A0P7AXI9_9HYPO|nr:hypothetical protein AK830_g7223 [Neonectria ditissima]